MGRHEGRCVATLGSKSLPLLTHSHGQAVKRVEGPGLTWYWSSWLAKVAAIIKTALSSSRTASRGAGAGGFRQLDPCSGVGGAHACRIDQDP